VKLLISWSGDRSKEIALAFRQCLPTVIQGLKPWTADMDLKKGSNGTRCSQRSWKKQYLDYSALSLRTFHQVGSYSK